MRSENNFNARLEETARELERIIDEATRWSGENASVPIAIPGLEQSEDVRATLLGFARLKGLTLEQLQFVQAGVNDLIEAKLGQIGALSVHLAKVSVAIKEKIRAQNSGSDPK